MILDTRYPILRLGQAVLVLLLAFTAAFILLSLIPGDGVTARFADPALGLSPDQIAEIRNATCADESWFGRYSCPQYDGRRFPVDGEGQMERLESYGSDKTVFLKYGLSSR